MPSCLGIGHEAPERKEVVVTKMRPLIVVTDHPFANLDATMSVLRSLDGEVLVAQAKTEDELISLVRDADAVLNTYAKITSRVVQEMKRCRIVARYGIGVDNVDIETCTSRGIIVTNVPDYCVDEVSDHALALLMCLARKVNRLDAAVKNGVWTYVPFQPMFRLRGKVLGLVGFGKIARQLASKARALGLEIVAYDPYLPPERIAAENARPVDLGSLMETSDFISVHCPLTPETRGLIGEAFLKKMKPTACLINTARGGIVDERALFEILKAGKIAGAALDVVSEEGPSVSEKLKGLDTLIVTPHAAFYSEESVVELQVKAATQVVKVLTGQRPDYPINPVVLASR